MPRNVEIKARVEDPSGIRRLVEQIADRGPTELCHVDTFFRCDNGRLKLREFADSSGELIHYQRADVDRPRESVFQVVHASDPAALKRILSPALGTLGVVTKTRLLYLAGPTRIHLDRVDGLGDFVELEVMLRDDQTTADGVAIATELMELLRIEPRHVEKLAYFDLLQRGNA